MTDLDAILRDIGMTFKVDEDLLAYKFPTPFPPDGLPVVTLTVEADE